MARTRGSRWPPVFLICGLVLLAAALADIRPGWLVAAAEALRRQPALSHVTLRALWLLRVWFAGAGLWLLWAAFVCGRSWEGAPVFRGRTAYWLYPGAAAVGLTFWTVPLGFLGDDYLWLTAWAERGLGLLAPEPGSPHYIPLGLLLCNAPQMLVGMSAGAYHCTSIVLHAAVAGLVAHAAAATDMRPVHAVGAGVVFATTALAYEPLLWATGQFYLWAGVATAAVLGVLLRDPAELSPRAAWLAGVLAAAAGFVIEQAAAVTLLAAFWAAVGGGRRARAAVRVPMLLFPLCGGLALLALRAGTRPIAGAFGGPAQVAHNLSQVLGGTVLLNSPAGHMLGGWLGAHPVTSWACVLALLIAVACLAGKAGAAGRTLLTAWCLLWLPAVLFAPQASRYWYLPAIPLSIGVMRLLAEVERRLAPTPQESPWPLSVGAVAAWVALGAVAMGLRAPDWRAADRIARHVEGDLFRAVQAAPATRRVVVAGVPDGVGTDLWPAYVFNNGLAEAVRWRAQRAGAPWSGEVELLEGPLRPWPGAYTAAGGPPLPLAQLVEALEEPDTLVYVYDPAREGLRPWAEAGA